MGRCAGARAPELNSVQIQPLPIHLPPPEVSPSEGTRLYTDEGAPFSGLLVIAISSCLVPSGFWQGPERHDLRVLRVI
jgi:hypothetical protein